LRIGLKNVYKRFAVQIVMSGIGYSFYGTGPHCLLGGSGCGKTSVLRLMAGLIEPDSGSVEIAGISRVSMVFQDDCLLPWADALQNVTLVRPGNDENALELLRRLDLEDAADKRPDELSGGMRQRVSFARALHYGGDALLLDEPFKGLDPLSKEDAVTLIREHMAQKFTLFITHDVDEALALASRIVVLGGPPLRIIREFELDTPINERQSDSPELSWLRRELLQSFDSQDELLSELS